MDKITDYQAAAADADNDTIDIITGAKGANSGSIDVKSAIAGGGGSENVTAAVTNGVVTLSGSDAGLINTLSEWIDAVSVNGVIKKAADDADAVGAVAFQLNGNTYLVESNDTSNNKHSKRFYRKCDRVNRIDRGQCSRRRRRRKHRSYSIRSILN